MEPSSSLVIGLDIGATKTMAGLVTERGEIALTRMVATAASPTAIQSSARALCEALIVEAKAPVIAIGIGSAGIINTRKRAVAFANENIPGWTGTAFADFAIERLPVIAENDARALAYGEALLGAGKDHDSLLCLTVGTGIGGALILDGEIWHGANFSAGEIGYLVVGWEGETPLILDQFASGPAIERAYQAATRADAPIPLTEISQLARAGDASATAVIQSKARQLGAILAGLVAAFDPQAVVIGGGVPQIGALWWDALVAAFRESAPPPVRAMAAAAGRARGRSGDVRRGNAGLAGGGSRESRTHPARRAPGKHALSAYDRRHRRRRSPAAAG